MCVQDVAMLVTQEINTDQVTQSPSQVHMGRMHLQSVQAGKGDAVAVSIRGSQLGGVV